MGDRLVIQTEGGLGSVLAGAALAGIGILQLAGVVGSPSAWFCLGPLGLAFTGMGVAVALSRKQLVLDRAARRVELWAGRLRPHRMAQLDFSEVTVVSVLRETRGSGKNRRTVFPVRAGGVELSAPGSYRAARSLSERVAGLLEVEILDAGEGFVVRRPAGTFDTSLADQLLAAGSVPQLPEPPGQTRAQLESKGTEVRAHLPAAGMATAWPWLLLGLFPAMVLALFVTLGAMNLGCLLAYLAVATAAVADVGLTGTTLRFDASGVGVYRGVGGWRRSHIPRDELEELFVTERTVVARTQPVLVARSDRATLTFGAGLDRDELAWLRDMIRFALITG